MWEVGRKLAQGLFMAVVCVRLGYNDRVRRVYLREMIDVCGYLSSSKGELGMILRSA